MKIKCDTDYMLRCAMIESKVVLNMHKRAHIDADIICEESYGEIEFVHLTYDDCIDNILDEGFIAGDGTLGYGVYVVNPSESKSLNSLINFYDDLCEGCDNMVIVRGKYKGHYIQSLHAINEQFKYTEGFILLSDVSKIRIKGYEKVLVSEIESRLKSLNKDTI